MVRTGVAFDLGQRRMLVVEVAPDMLLPHIKQGTTACWSIVNCSSSAGTVTRIWNTVGRSRVEFRFYRSPPPLN
ncbi:MAG TPA: hypothetical protein VL051_03440 [Burkholderiaceae bacterium]|nr:hypothetical protein [Burkholderiaceae bacterium]